MSQKLSKFHNSEKKVLPVIALAGQPNCGKSTIFNAVAGIKVNTGNFAGTTITYTETKVRFEGENFILIDLPGTYSISSSDMAEKVARDYLLDKKADIIINVIDTSTLSRSLEFTLQLVEMKVPMVVAFNMIDEAERKGIIVDIEEFKRLTGLTGIPVIGIKGEGIDQLFRMALNLINQKNFHPIAPVYDREIEETINEAIRYYPTKLADRFNINNRFVVMRMLEMDEEFEKVAHSISPQWAQQVIKDRQALAHKHDWSEEEVFSSHRHAIVLNLYEKIAHHKRLQRKKDLRDYFDRIVMNPLGGILTVILSILLMFYVAVDLGDIISKLFDPPFEKLNSIINNYPPGILHSIISGSLQGIQAGVGIVLPYLLPLLMLLAIYEDAGLLPRIAFMIDGILHRFGLHGKSVLPMILGYGCSVPAVMAIRNLDSERERFLSRLIVPLIPCSARTVIILGLVGKYLGPWWTTVIYLGNMVVALVASLILSKFLKNSSYGIIMDVPPIRYPNPLFILKKVWPRLKEFLMLGGPVLIISSIILSILSLYGIDDAVNKALSPITVKMLNLPAAVGITIFLGFFRKELALLMLSVALGTNNISSVLSPVQILVLTIFLVLYIPCVASVVTLYKEGGLKTAISSALLNFFLALLVASTIAKIF